MCRSLILLLIFVLCATPAVAQQRPPVPQRPLEKLSELPPDQQVASLGYCNGTYIVTTKDGAKLPFGEFNLRFKTDSSDYGPTQGAPALLAANMMGDRAFVIFANPEEISGSIKRTC